MQGDIPRRFARLRDLLDQQLVERRHLGVAVCIYQDGEPVVDAWGGEAEAGRPWERDTRATVFSTTKGVTATCLHLLAERGKVALDDPVVRHWPTFARKRDGTSKERVTVRHVLSHQGGIPVCPEGVTCFEQTLDWDFMVREMEGLLPAWEPGTANGYHAINYGWLVGELIRRVSGQRVGAFLRDEVAEPLRLEAVDIGLPDALHSKVAPLEPPPPGHRPTEGPNEDLRDPTSIASRTILRPEGDLVAFMNTPAARSAEYPASGGIATARGLARLYACLAAGGTLDGVRLLSPSTLAQATTLQVPEGRRDLVLGVPLRWALGFHKGGEFSATGPNPNSFGHAGYGGSLAFADPDARLSFAIVLNRMQNELQGGFRVLLAVKAVYDSLADAGG
ncbi:MAG TPA: serine hydrolase domain-containing protein [Myxococcota bacterium]|nr:serine hydrolase domain-containing protein [Myxococcota bacterium]